MCEFCTFPTNVDPDSMNFEFAGFFSPQAIEAAVKQANANHSAAGGDGDDDDDADVGDEDSDGT